jgi:hypothetical protein
MAAVVAKGANVEKRLLPKLPVWATVVHVLMLMLSLMAVVLPQGRPLIRPILGGMVMLVAVHSVVRLKQANALRMGLREFSRHAPSSFTATENLEMAAIFIGCYMSVFVL